MFCSACGQPNSDDATFCSKCGKQIASILAAQAPAPGSVLTSPNPEGFAQKQSGIVTAMSVVGLVFGLIGMMGSFIPIIGIFAIKICVGAAILSGLAVVLALSQNVSRTFPIVSLTISLIGISMIYVQISKIESATETVRKFTEELKNKPQPKTIQQKTNNLSGQQKNQNTTQQVIITNSFMASGLDANNHPIDKKDRYSPGQMTLWYYFSYAGAIQGNTVFYTEILYKGNNIMHGQATASYTSGNHSFSFNRDFLPGQYEVRLLSNGQLINKIYFYISET